MKDQRKNWMNRHSTLIGLLIVLSIILIQIIQPTFIDSSQYIKISKMIQKSEECSSNISSFDGDSVSYKKLNLNPEFYTRQLIKITGYINQVQELNGKGIIFLQLPKEKASNSDDVMYINYSGHADFVENNMVDVYGFITGTYLHTSENNNKITYPNITSCKIVKVK